MQTLTWFWQAVLATVLVIPAWLGITFAGKFWHIRGDVILLWYNVGVVIGASAWIFFSRAPLATSSRSFWIVLLGLTLGAAVNILIFRAVATAPNPGLPVAIHSASSVVLFLATFVLAFFLPKYVTAGTFSWKELCGIFLTMTGVALISLK